MEITCIDCQHFGDCEKDPCADDGVCNDFTPEAWAEEENENNDPANRETKK